MSTAMVYDAIMAARLLVELDRNIEAVLDDCYLDSTSGVYQVSNRKALAVLRQRGSYIR